MLSRCVESSFLTSVLMAVAASASCGGASTRTSVVQSEAAPACLDPTDYDVYGGVFTYMVERTRPDPEEFPHLIGELVPPSKEFLVIREMTEITGSPTQRCEAFTRNADKYDPSAAKDVEERNAGTCPLDAALLSAHSGFSNIEILPDAEYAGMFESEEVDGWDVFNQKYPGAFSLISLSMVGFGEDGKTAVVYVTTASGWRSGGGEYLLLVLEEGQWKVIDSVNEWKAV